MRLFPARLFLGLVDPGMVTETSFQLGRELHRVFRYTHLLIVSFSCRCNKQPISLDRENLSFWSRYPELALIYRFN